MRETDALVDELRGFSPLAQRTAKSFLTIRRMRPCPSPSSLKDIVTVACATRMISAKASKPSTPSARRSFAGAKET